MIVPINQPVATAGPSSAIDGAGNFASTTLVHPANWAIVRMVGSTVGNNAIWTLAADNGQPVDFANGPLASMGQVLVAPGQRMVLTISAATTFAVVNAQYVGLMSPSLEELLPHYTPSPNPLGATVRGAISLVGGEGNFTDVIVTGITGANTQSRWVGAVSGAAPTAGSFAVGDYVVDLSATSPGFWVCTLAGTPGTWVRSESLMPVAMTIRADTLIGSPAGAQLVLNKTTAPGNAGVTYREAGVDKWFAGKEATNHYLILDQVNNYRALELFPTAQAAFAGEVQAPDVSVNGLTGAVNASRYVGATTGGAPTAGTFAVGDWIVDRNGNHWQCVTAGTPGTWRRIDGIFGLGASLVGTASSINDRVLEQEFSFVGTTDAGGNLAITYPNAFPNKVININATVGDNANALSQVQVQQSTVSLTGFTAGCLNNTGGVIATLGVRVNVHAVGA